MHRAHFGQILRCTGEQGHAKSTSARQTAPAATIHHFSSSEHAQRSRGKRGLQALQPTRPVHARHASGAPLRGPGHPEGRACSWRCLLWEVHRVSRPSCACNDASTHRQRAPWLHAWQRWSGHGRDVSQCMPPLLRVHCRPRAGQTGPRIHVFLCIHRALQAAPRTRRTIESTSHQRLSQSTNTNSLIRYCCLCRACDWLNASATRIFCRTHPASRPRDAQIQHFLSRSCTL